MRTIYIDTNYICHADNAEGRIAVETNELDNVCDEALNCYKFIPAHEGKAVLIQCFNADKADAIHKAVDRAQTAADEKQMELLDIIEELILEG